MNRYEAWITRLRLAVMGEKGQAIFGGYAALLGDRFVAWARQAQLEHLPEKASRASNGLTATERTIEPGPNESDTALATRLTTAVQARRRSGAPAGLLLALTHAELGDKLICVQQNGLAWKLVPLGSSASSPTWNRVEIDDSEYALWYAFLGPNPAIGGNQPLAAGETSWWAFDDGLDDEGNQFNSRFALIFEADSTVDLTVSANLQRLCRVVGGWKPAKATFVKVYRVSAPTGHYWGEPGLAWGDPGLVWGGTVITEYTC